MNNIYALTKIFFKKSGIEKSRKKNKRVNSGLSKILLPALIAVFLIPIVGFISKMYDFLANANQPGLFINIACSITTIIIFVFGISYVLTTFYFTKDIELLLPLPLKPYEIVSAKFITVLIYEYITELIVLGPFLAIYGYKGSLGITYWITAILVLLILPIVPLMLAALLNMIIMRFTNLGKYKDTFKVITGIISLAIAIGVNLVYRSNASRLSQEQTVNMLTGGKNSLVGVIGNIFPTSNWATYSLIGKSTNEIVLNLALFVSVSALAIIIFIIAAQKLYFKGVVGISESFAKRKKLGSKDIEKSTKQNSKVKVYISKEIKVLFRTPVFLLNCVITSLIYPAFLVIGLYTNMDSYFSKETLGGFFANKEIEGIIIGISFAVALFIASNNVVASTSISREGQNMYINKYLPISYKEQIFAKIFPAIVINMVNILLIILVFIFMLGIPIKLAILIYIVSILGIMISSSLGIIFDIKKPKLNWNNEQKAIKQNFNPLKNVIFCLGIIAITVYLTIQFKPTLIVATGTICVISLMIIAAIYYYIITKGQKAYSKVE